MAELLQACKVPLIEAFFAKMEPHSDIKPHSDGCNFVLTSHLGVDVPEEPYLIEIGKANVARAGTDVTLVGIGYTTLVCHEAAELLAERGYSAEVIDLLSISPLDEETILECAEETGRVVVVDEANPRCSMASDVAALIGQNAFGALKAPVKMVTPPHTPVPFAPELEDAYIPSMAKIESAVREVAEFAR